MAKKIYKKDEFDGELDFSLLEQYIHSKDEALLKQWIQSDDSLKTAVQILRGFDKVIPGGRQAITAYLPPVSKYIGGIHPELISRAYILMVPLVSGFKPDKGATIKTYLFTYLTKQLVNEFARERSNVSTNFATPVPVISDEGDEVDVFDMAYDKDSISPTRAAALEDYFSKLSSLLSDKLAETIFLYTVQGYTQEEISDLLNVKLGSVRYSLNKTRGLIKEHLLEDTLEITRGNLA